jgi:nucleotide-binding universal stress UspA family protein
MADPQIIPKILVTTDFSVDSEIAFFHALAITLARKARLTLLHTGSESREQVKWDRFPGVRRTLRHWQLLAEDAPKTDVVDKLGIGVNKLALRDDNPRNGITDYLRRSPTDLLVMATEGRSGLSRLRHTSVAETVSFRTKSHALILPKKGRGFVDPNTGKSRLARVLCVLDARHDPRTALSFLGRWLPCMSHGEVEVDVVQVAGDAQYRELLVPEVQRLRWQGMNRTGEFVPTVIGVAADLEPDLIAMHADSPINLRGRIRGSRIDRVMQATRLPVLSLPVL